MSEQQNAAPASSWVDEARAAIAGGRSFRETLAAVLKSRFAKLPSLKPRELIALAVLVTAIVCGAGVAFVRALPRGGGGSAKAASVVAKISSAPSASASPSIVVYVTGAVLHPGVYDFEAGARVIDAVKRAGGPTPQADLDAMNLAAPLVDGSRLYVPHKGEAPPPDATGGAAGGSGAVAGGKVDINTATAAELDAGVPGVGPVLAQRIVDYRTQHGPFRAVEDLMKVQGIGQKKFDSLKDYVTV